MPRPDGPYQVWHWRCEACWDDTVTGYDTEQEARAAYQTHLLSWLHDIYAEEDDDDA